MPVIDYTEARAELERLWILFLAVVATLGGWISPIGDAGRRMRTWALERLRAD